MSVGVHEERCSCGNVVECREFTNECQCGNLYNFCGQKLALVEQWGEETGEDWWECW